MAGSGLDGWATIGTIAAFYTYSRRFAAPLRQLGNLYNQIQAALAGAERIFETINTKSELADAPDAIVLEDIAGEVVFEQVDFGYVPGVPVIKDMSLVARPGQTIALVGPTGAGKTTLINLLARFYDVDGGSIYIGVPSSNCDVSLPSSIPKSFTCPSAPIWTFSHRVRATGLDFGLELGGPIELC